MSATEIPMLMVGFGSSVVELFVQLGGASTPILNEAGLRVAVGRKQRQAKGAIESPVSFVSSIGILCVTDPGPTESDPMTTLHRRYSITFLLALAGSGLSKRWLLFASAAPGAWLHFSL
ncbi:hypothetical protein DYB35_012276 [Aphanomyces astaci]|uniref:H(+)-exporting diphosphatase n=1 Tax=Aphanomyces astaci TaxID=112090 RepID=A0A3R6XF12_APHAT|nr:hypothetical protein DYB35_012276 [Aphanomyces astaci]